MDELKKGIDSMIEESKKDDVKSDFNEKGYLKSEPGSPRAELNALDRKAKLKAGVVESTAKKPTYQSKDYGNVRVYPNMTGSNMDKNNKWIGNHYSLMEAHNLNDDYLRKNLVGKSKSGSDVYKMPDGYLAGNPRINNASFKTMKDLDEWEKGYSDHMKNMKEGSYLDSYIKDYESKKAAGNGGNDNKPAKPAKYVPQTSVEKKVDAWIEANWNKIDKNGSLGNLAYNIPVRAPYPVVMEAVSKSVAARNANSNNDDSTGLSPMEESLFGFKPAQMTEEDRELARKAIRDKERYGDIVNPSTMVTLGNRTLSLPQWVERMKNSTDPAMGREIMLANANKFGMSENQMSNYLDDNGLTAAESMSAYQFPALTEEDLKAAEKYGLKVMGTVNRNDDYNTKGDVVLEGSKDQLAKFADEVLGGYDMNEDYFYEDSSSYDPEVFREEEDLFPSGNLNEQTEDFNDAKSEVDKHKWNFKEDVKTWLKDSPYELSDEDIEYIAKKAKIRGKK